MRSTEAFEAFYSGELIHNLREVDVIRKKILKAGFTMLGILLIPVAVVLAIHYFFDLSQQNQVVLFGVAGLVVAAGMIYMAFKVRGLKYRKTFKTKVMEPIIRFISDDLKYFPKEKIMKGDFVNSRLFLNRIDRYKGDDYVEGTIDKTKFRFSELHVQYKTSSTDSKGNTKTQWHTVFKGLFFIADFNKEFKGSTVLLPNYFGKGLSILKKVFGLNRKEKLVKLEDPEFSKNFNCYSTDDIKARYILSPALMKRISAFKEKYPKNPVFISFVDGKIYIAISYSKDLFEPTYFKSLVNIDTIKTYFEDVKFAVDIVEELNLNTRIWTKE